MLLPDFAPINETFNTVSPAIDRWLGQNASAEMASALRTRAETDRPRIMVYGVYNAGKSTLLNALLGSEQAAMADRPETAEIRGYDWRGYTLLDTPASTPLSSMRQLLKAPSTGAMSSFLSLPLVVSRQRRKHGMLSLTYCAAVAVFCSSLTTRCPSSVTARSMW